MEKVDDKANYEILFENEECIKQIAKNYSDNWGFELKNQQIIAKLLEAEGKATDKDTFNKLKGIFGLKVELPKVEVKTSTTEAPKDGEKKDEAPKEGEGEKKEVVEPVAS